MSKVGIYPGTFDPITNGHIDVIMRSLKIVNKLIVGVSNGYSKDYLFSSEERVSIIKNSLFKDLKIKNQRVKVLFFNTLTTASISSLRISCEPYGIIPSACRVLSVPQRSENGDFCQNDTQIYRRPAFLTLLPCS